jgi:hypothetical protein
VDGILGHNLLLSRAFSVGIPSWMGFWATTYCCLGPFLTTLPSFHDVILAIKKPFSRTFLFYDGIVAIRKPFSQTFLFSRWNSGYQKAFLTNFYFFTMEFWLSESLFHELFFFTMEFWLSESLFHELFFFTMEFWLSESLFHDGILQIRNFEEDSFHIYHKEYLHRIRLVKNLAS